MITKMKGKFFNQEVILSNVSFNYIVLYFNILLIWIVSISHLNPFKFRFTKGMLQSLSQGFSNTCLYFIPRNITPNNCNLSGKRICFESRLDMYNYMPFSSGIFYILAASSKKIPLAASLTFN